MGPHLCFAGNQIDRGVEIMIRTRACKAPINGTAPRKEQKKRREERKEGKTERKTNKGHISREANGTGMMPNSELSLLALLLLPKILSDIY